MSSKFWKKLTSVKNLLVMWSVGLITYIVASERNEFANVAMMLTAAVVVYFPVNVKQKELFEKKIKGEL